MESHVLVGEICSINHYFNKPKNLNNWYVNCMILDMLVVIVLDAVKRWLTVGMRESWNQLDAEAEG